MDGKAKNRILQIATGEAAATGKIEVRGEAG